MSSVDDRLLRTAPVALGVGGVVLAVLPLAGLPAVPLVGDLALIGVSAAIAALAGWGLRRRAALLALPLTIGPVAVRDPGDGRVRVQLWLGMGRAMRDVSLTASAGGKRVTAAAAGPVIGPWTAVLDLPDGPIHITAQCRGGGRTWTAEATVAHTAIGRFAPPVVGSPGALAWDRSAWGAPLARSSPGGVQDM